MPLPLPRDDEILIQVLYSGVNPSDFRVVQLLGCRKRVLGNEFCGRVLDGPGLKGTSFKPGDIVAGYTNGSNGRPARYGTHQGYISIPPSWAYKVPDNLPHPNAAALTVVVQTTNNALFNRLGLPLPYKVAGPTNGTLVIWGAASSVGMAAVQLARASRVTSIIVTASPKRHAFLESLGATHCYDYADQSTPDKIKDLLHNAGSGPIWGFDAIGTNSTPDSQTLLAQSIPSSENVRLVTVLLVSHDGFMSCIGARHYDVSFDLPNGEKIAIASNLEEADRMWKVLEWVVRHFGNGFQETPVRLFGGSAEDAIEQVARVGAFGTFGKVVLALPWVN